VAPGMGVHAELAGVYTLLDNGLTPAGGAASRTICPDCRAGLVDLGAIITSETTYMFPAPKILSPPVGQNAIPMGIGGSVTSNGSGKKGG